MSSKTLMKNNLTGLCKSLIQTIIGRSVEGNRKMRLNFSITSILLFVLASPALHALPDNPGAITGNFNVSPGGAASYSIPIVVPPGVKGLQPKLSLEYDSKAGNGSLGVGWSLAGLSRISRCPTTLVQDGFIDGVDFDANDKFCFGGQRLIAIGGVYGASGTEYRTEIESYSKITSHGAAGNGPAYFIVKTKSGQTEYYGNTADSRIEAKGRAEAAVWSVNRIVDENGNYIDFSYSKGSLDSYSNYYLINKINYTGNEKLATLPHASVEFTYQNRTDTITQFYAGNTFKLSKRLVNIKTYAGSSTTPILNYQLGYDNGTATKRSRLISLKECDAASKCKISSTFKWNDSTISITPKTWNWDGWGTKDYTWTGDFNGDGRTDLASANGTNIYMNLSTDQGFDKQLWHWDAWGTGRFTWVGDFNGDGKTDIASASGTNVYMYFSTGSSFTKKIWYWDDWGHEGFAWAGDFDGDGKTDLASGYGNNFYVYFSRGTGFEKKTWHWDAWGTIGFTWTGDFDGDGRTDVASGSGTNFYVYFSRDWGLEKKTWYWDAWGTEGFTWTGDFDGDGRTDVASGSGTNFYVYFSRDWGLEKKTWYWDAWGAEGFAWTGDFDGDGRTDLATALDTNFYIYLSKEQGLEKKTLHWDSWGSIGLTRAGDFNGDGRMDVASAWGNNVYMYHSPQTAIDRINTIAEASKDQYSISYLPLTNNSVYTKYTWGSYPYVDVQDATYVVSEYAKADGVSGMNTYSYHYEGAKIHVQGRGELGFLKVTMTDQQTGFVSDMYLNQSYPNVGMVNSTKTSVGSVVLKFSVNTNTFYISNGTSKDELGKIYVIEQPEITNWANDLNGAFISHTLTEEQRDFYGNVTQLTNSSFNSSEELDGYKSEVSNDYKLPDTSSWVINKLTCSTVTSYTPLNGSAVRRTGFEHDATGRLVKEVVEPDSADCISPMALSVVTDYAYDGYGNKSSAAVSGQSISTRTTSYNYDYSLLSDSVNPQYKVVTTNALGHSETNIIDARFGALTSLTGPNGITTNWSYDSLGRKTGEYRADGTSKGIAYSICETSAACADPLQQSLDAPLAISSTRYTKLGAERKNTVYLDILGREILTTTTGFEGELINKQTVYGSNGEISKLSAPFYAALTPVWMTYEYDKLDRVKKETKPDGSISTITYNGLETTTSNDLGQTTTTLKDSQGQLVKSTDADSNSNTYSYWAFGKLKSVTDAASNVTSLSYDIRGNKLTMDDPDMGHWEYKYDVLGNLIWQKDAKGQIFTMEYDSLNRKTFYRIIDTATSYAYDTTNWVYDRVTKGIGKLGWVVRYNNVDNTYERKVMQYDSLGRTSRVEITDGRKRYETRIEYDPDTGRVLKKTYPNAFSVTYGYDPASGMLSSVVDSTVYGSYIPIWNAVQVNARGQIYNQDFGNGLKMVRTFDGATGRLRGIATGIGGGMEVQDISYVYDTLGNLVERKDSNKAITESFSYDSLSRLTSSLLLGPSFQHSLNTYQYDAIGNITYKSDVGTYSYAATKPHAVMMTTPSIPFHLVTKYGYDENGNMVVGDGRAITYTPFNKPKTITTGTVSNRYYYGVQNQRIRKVSLSGNTATTTTYIGKEYEEVNKPSGVTEHRYYVSLAGATYIYTKRDDGTKDRRYLLKDHLGSVDVITDESGLVTERLSFAPFGSRRNLDAGLPNPSISSYSTRGFTGHEMEDKIGLINMNARLYDSKLGRFIQADTIVQFPDSTQGFNRYTYVDNNPLSYTDPTGHGLVSITVGSIIGGSVGSVIGYALGKYNDDVKNAVNKAHQNIKREFRQEMIGFSRRANNFFFHGGDMDAREHWNKNKHTYELAAILGPGVLLTKNGRNFVVKYEWAEYGGEAAASYYGGSWGAAGWAAYMSWARGESEEDIVTNAAIAGVTANASNKILGKSTGIERSYVSAAVFGEGKKRNMPEEDEDTIENPSVTNYPGIFGQMWTYGYLPGIYDRVNRGNYGFILDGNNMAKVLEVNTH